MKINYLTLFLLATSIAFGQIPKPLTVTTFTDFTYTDVEPTAAYGFDFPVAADILTADPATHQQSFSNRYFMSAYGPRHKEVATSNIVYFDFHKGSDMTPDVAHGGMLYDDLNPPDILCVCDGVIHEIFTPADPEITGTGNFVTVRCNDNFAANPAWGNIYTAYRHLATIAVGLNEGDAISKGDVVGLMGATGHTTTVHLHFSVIRLNTGSEENVHPMRIFSPTAAPHLLAPLTTVEITQLEHTATEALFRIAIPHNQANIRAIEVTLNGTAYSRVYDYETVAMLPEEDRDDNNIVPGFELYAYPFNRGHELYRRVWDRYTDGQITADYPASPDAANFFPYLSEGIPQIPAYGLDMRVTGLPNGFNPVDLNIKIIDIWGYGVEANGVAQPTNEHFAWSMINEENDDAEEYDTGTMSLISPDLEMVFDDSHGNQTVGLYFENINIPNNATLTDAWLQFRADESHSGATDLDFNIQNATHPAPFTTNVNDLSDRMTTNTTVNWLPSPWTENDMNADQKVTGLAGQLQELISMPAWDNSSAITYLVTGTGRRTAERYDPDDWWRNAYLYVEYTDAAFLPLELTDFYGFAKAKSNHLYWEVAIQQNVAWMLLERSENSNTNWQEIGRIAGEGTTSIPHFYDWEDHLPFERSYYRLKILDFDGKEQYSKMISIARNDLSEIAITPNPAHSVLNISITNSNSVDYVLYSTLGKAVLEGNMELGNGQIDLAALPAGIYFLNINAQTFKVVKE